MINAEEIRMTLRSNADASWTDPLIVRASSPVIRSSLRASPFVLVPRAINRHPAPSCFELAQDHSALSGCER